MQSNGPVFHQFGTKLDRVKEARKAIELCGLDWTVSLKPVYVDGREAENHNAVVRDDTGEILGWCANRYHPIQNEEVFNFFDESISDEIRYVAGGSSKSGKIVWLIAETPMKYVVFPGDAVQSYILLASSHNGSISVTIQNTPMRILCSNIVSGMHSASSFKIRHTNGYKQYISDAHDALGIARGSETSAKLARSKLRMRISEDQIKRVVDKAFPSNNIPRHNPHLEKVTEILHTEPTCNVGEMSGTGWALYNAITFYLDHAYQGRNDAMYRSVFGRGRRIRKAAYKAITALQ